jgi:hypothetical protein
MTTPDDDRPRPDATPPAAWDAPPPGWGAQPASGYGGQYSSPPQPGWGPPPGYGASPGYGAPWGGPQETESKAIIALVLAIASFVAFPLIPAIVALVLAGQARQAIDTSGGRLTGAGLVTAAKVISWINIAFCVLVIVLVVVAFGLFASVGVSAVTVDPIEITPAPA